MDDEAWLRHFAETEVRIQNDPELWTHLLHIQIPGLPLIDSLPQPGDVIRDNGSPCEVMVEKFTINANGLHFECRVIDWQTRQPTHHKCYYGGFDLTKGRLQSRLKCCPGITGYDIFARGQKELFILRRAKGQLGLFT